MDLELEVVGRHALFFDDDAHALFVNSKEALVEWNSLFIDRYDVRHLLSNPPASFRKLRYGSSPPLDTHLESELDLERYADLPSNSDEAEKEVETEARDAGRFHAVPFSYGYSADSSEQKNSELTVETSAFHPPFHVPESLLQNLPSTEKLHQIIARTAIFVSKHGGQSEIVLRVKQGDNPTFGFLMPHHDLHPYFRYLVDHPKLLMDDDDGKSQDKKNHDQQITGALSLLGSVYGSGEDEDGEMEVPRESEQMDFAEPAAGETSKSGHLENTTVMSQKDEINPKHALSSKVKATALNKNRITSIKPALPNAIKKDVDVRVSTCPDTDKSIASGLFSKAETLSVDPPSEIKRLVDRIVEIILKNGKNFEAVLVEQDKKHGKFPFLLPSNHYHPYYLKVLKKAQETRRSGKSFSSEKGGSSWLEMDSKSASVKESSDHPSSGLEPHELPLEYDNDRKERFKMIINKSKKDSHDYLPKEAQQQPAVRVDAAAAAAILQAATRGIKKPHLDIFSKTPLNGENSSNEREASSSHQSSQRQNSAQKLREKGRQSVTVPVAKEIAKTAALQAASEADSSEAGLSREQKLKAERLRRAKMFAAMIKSSVAPVGKEPLCSLSVDPPGSRLSGSGTNPVNEESKDRDASSVQEEGVNFDIVEKSKRDSSNDENEHKSRKRRHYRSRKHDNSEGEDDLKIENDDHEEKEEEDRRRSRKKHRSHRSSRHNRDRSKDRHKHSRRKHSSSKSKETRHHYKHESSSEGDDYGHDHHNQHKHDTYSEDERKHSSSKIKETRHHHKHESSSEGDDCGHHHHNRHKHDTYSEAEQKHHKRRHKHGSSEEDEKKHRKRTHKGSKDKDRHPGKSSKEEKFRSQEVELEEGEIRAKSSDQSPSIAGDHAYGEASVEGSKSSNQETRTPSLPPPETTVVPDELRAKIRAMLLATM